MTEQIWNASISSNTAAVYRTGFDCFHRYLLNSGTVAMLANNLPDIDENVLISFVTYCYHTLQIKLATIKLYLSGVRHYYLKHGHVDPLKSTDRLECILRGIKRLQGQSLQTKSSKRYPVTFSILKDIVGLLSKGFLSPFLDTMMIAVCQLAFFGFLRCGEFTLKCSNELDNCILLSDVYVDTKQSFYVLSLKVSKTDPFRQGVKIFIFENVTIKPVQSMIKYIRLRQIQNANEKSVLFVDDTGVPLTRSKFIEYFRHILASLGINDSNYCGHSFRIGAATTAAAAGIEDHLIQTLGRWSSNCYTRYIRTSQESIKQAQMKMYV